MKKIFTYMAFLMFGLATFTTSIASPLRFPQQQHLKKDGTPDKRYNENKHLKKDGTPDKRFKTTKKAAAKKK